MKKRILTAVMVLGAVISGISAWNGGMVQAEAAENQNPVISGTSQIQVLKDEAFSAEDILSRVYAMDYEDGDLTQDISIVSNTVNTSEAGSYAVVYEVTDSDGGKGTLTTTVDVVESYDSDGQKIQKTLYTKEAADHLTNVGLYRGYNHDRQHLGIYMKAGSSLKIRIANWEDVLSYLELDILGNDSNIEITYTIPYDGQWLTIPAEDVTEDMVPFIHTPQTGVQPIVEYYVVDGDMEELTYYCYGDDEDAFFETWNSNAQEYAVVEGERITMLIPRIDKDIILNNPTTREEYQFTALDEMLEYYQDVQEQYDEYVGLSYDPEAATDKNVRGRYFLKADENGVGAAYYSGYLYIAENSNSISGYLKRDWMSLHELAHGYDTTIASGDLPLVETINNILGHYYERRMLAEGDDGWSGLQNLESVEEGYFVLVDSGVPFANMSFDARLYCMLNLLNALDAKEMMSELHRAWRAEEHTGTTDFIVEHFSETSGYNLVPYFEDCGIYTSETAKSRIYEKNYPMLDHFYEYFSDTALAKEAKEQLGDTVMGYYGLVSTEALAGFHKTGNIQIQIEIDDMKQLDGKEIRILDGNKEVASVQLTKDMDSNNVFVENVPIGTYRVELPAAASTAYYAEYAWVTVTVDSTTVVDAIYKEYTDNPMRDDAAIVLQGLSDVIFSTVSTNLEKGTVTITTEAMQPHYYFENEYASIEIFSPEGKSLYSRSYIGATTYEYEQENVNVPVGSRIRVAHVEMAWRVNVQSQFLAEIRPEYMENYKDSDEYVEFVLTENGWKRADWTEEQFGDVRSGILESVLECLKEDEQVQTDRNVYQKVKAMVSVGVLSLNEESREYFEAAYPYLFVQEPQMENPFEDVGEEVYYYVPVLWALEQEITEGTSDVQFSPDNACTRGQVVTFLWRAAGKPAANTDVCPFADVKQGEYYYDAVLWAVEQGITDGTSDTAFSPNATCTRGQVVTFLWRNAGKPQPADTSCVFTDIQSGEYYYDAVLWAVEKEITQGSGDTTFSPNDTCTRGHVVTFLYRAKVNA